MNRILLYGATGYSGKLIAREAAQRLRSELWAGDFTLASRDQRALEELAAELGLRSVAFALLEREPVVGILKRFDVLINAAGPFTRTASRLAKAALDADCHYVDLTSELDVYMALDDHAPLAAMRRLAMVCSAGWTSVASDVLLEHALGRMEPSRRADLRTLRIAVSPSPFLSRGSAITMARALREQVTVWRRGGLSHVPIGQLERKFEFGSSAGQGSPRIASASNLPDTLTAMRTASRLDVPILDIETYVAMSDTTRAAYWIGSLGAAAVQLPFTQRLVDAQFSLLPDGPRADERKSLRETVAVEIENARRETVANWVLETDNLYDFSARSALDVAITLAAASKPPPTELQGWLTPSAVLSYAGATPLSGTAFASPFNGAKLYDRLNEKAGGVE